MASSETKHGLIRAEGRGALYLSSWPPPETAIFWGERQSIASSTRALKESWCPTQQSPVQVRSDFADPGPTHSEFGRSKWHGSLKLPDYGWWNPIIASSAVQKQASSLNYYCVIVPLLILLFQPPKWTATQFATCFPGHHLSLPLTDC